MKALTTRQEIVIKLACKEESLLHYAARQEDPRIMQQLLQNGGEQALNTVSEYGFTPLMAALVSDRQKVVGSWLDIQNLEIGYHSTLGCTNVHLAAKYGSPVTINSLLKRQRSLLSEVDNEGRTPLLVALQEDHCTDISIETLPGDVLLSRWIPHH